MTLNEHDSHRRLSTLANDRTIGGGIFAGSIAGVVIYAVLLFSRPGEILALTAFVGVALLLGILAWMGYTMATSPPPEPIMDAPESAPEKRAKTVETSAKQ